MGEVSVSMTVFFDGVFWVGVFERIEDGHLSASRIVFGAEPKDYEVHAFILKHYYELRFSPAVETAVKKAKKNPKRVQREITRGLADTGIGTASQKALKLQLEQNKLKRKTKSREQKLAEAERMFDLKQQKRKEKHRGH